MLENHKSFQDLLGHTLEDNTIDNQQARLFFDVGYLLGMIDGEGSTQFNRKYVSKNGVIYTPKIGIYNSNPFIIEKVTDIFDRYNIAYYIYSPKIHGKEQRPCIRVEIIGIKRVKKLTDFLLHFPSGKKERLQLLNDFCSWRLSIPMQQRLSEKNLQKEQWFRDSLKQKNFEHRGKVASETNTFQSFKKDKIESVLL